MKLYLHKAQQFSAKHRTSSNGCDAQIGPTRSYIKKVNANTKSVAILHHMMNTMSTRDYSKDANVAALEQTINGLVADAFDRQNPCNNTALSNQTVQPHATPEDYKKNGKYSFSISLGPHAISGPTETVSAKAGSVNANRHAVKTKNQPPTTWKEIIAPGHPTAKKYEESMTQGDVRHSSQ